MVSLWSEDQEKTLKPPKPLFTANSKAILWGMQPRAVQGMLDFDHLCSREVPSVAAMVYPFRCVCIIIIIIIIVIIIL